MNKGYMARRILAVVLCLMCILSSASAALAETKAYTKSKTTVYVEKNGKPVKAGSISKNTELTVVEIKGDWAKVKKDGKTAFVKTSKLKMEDSSSKKDKKEEKKQEKEQEAKKSDELTKCKKTKIYVTDDKATVYAKASTSAKSLGTVKNGTELTMTAYNDEWCQVKNGKKTGYIKRSKVSDTKPSKQQKEPAPATPEPEKKTGSSTASAASGRAVEMDWWTSGIQNIFARGTVAVITDVNTGISWKEKRTGGYNHADTQPLTAEDTAAMLKAYGGKWSWNRRPVWVSINGQKYAASMNGMPHGSGSISGNNFNGHHCIHFTNSRTHGTNRIDALHQSAIKKALAKG